MKAGNETNQSTQCLNKTQQSDRNNYGEIARETENHLWIATLWIWNNTSNMFYNTPCNKGDQLHCSLGMWIYMETLGMTNQLDLS